MTGINVPKEVIAFFLQDFPESVIMVLFVFSLLRLRFQWKAVVAIAFLQSLANFVRLLPVAAGIHTVILIITLSVLVGVFTRERPSKVFISVLVCFSVGLFLELVYLQPLIKLSRLSYETIFSNPYLRALFSLPYEVVLLVLALLKNYYNFKDERFSV